MRYGYLMVLELQVVFVEVTELHHLPGVVNLGLHRWSPFQQSSLIHVTRLLFCVSLNWGLWRIDINNIFLLLILIKEVILIILDPTNGGLRANVDLALLFGLRNIVIRRLTNLIWNILFRTLIIFIHFLVVSDMIICLVLLHHYMDLLI